MTALQNFVLTAACIALASAVITVVLANGDRNTPAQQDVVPAAGQSSLTVVVARLQPGTILSARVPSAPGAILALFPTGSA